MKFFDYLNGQGGLMVLALIVIIALLVNKYKNYKYLKDVEKRRKNKNK